MSETQNTDIQTTIPAWKVLNLLPCTPELEKSDPTQASQLYEDALTINPGSYKVWHAYLLHKTRQTVGKNTIDPSFAEVNQCYEKALVFMHRMPRIWLEYCCFLKDQLFITRTRRAFDKALEALPITQHSRIWKSYIEFATSQEVPVETGVRIMKRYIQFRPDDIETYIDYSYSKGLVDEAARLLCDVINDPHFKSTKGKSKYELWDELSDMLSEFSHKIHSVDVESILRDAIKRYPDQEGRLWTCLSRCYIDQGLFGCARNIFEEGIQCVRTKKAFVEVWEAFTNFEEKYLERILENEDLDEDEMIEFEIRQAALEELTNQNRLLLNRVAIRQNPHNVFEWKKRIELCDQLENPVEAKNETYTEALRTIDSKKATGNVEELWIDFALSQANSGHFSRAREIFERAIKANYVKSDDLAKVWCSYIEFEIRVRFSQALNLAKRASAHTKSLRVWALYADLEENFGTLTTTKAVYERILDLKIATPQLILNYASFLEDRQHYEDSFRVFERGISLFNWPTSYNLWTTYIDKFLTRYGLKKLDRIRDILDECLKDCPKKFAFEFFVLYAKIEEEVGLLSRAQDIYKAALEYLDADDRDSMYKIYSKSIRYINETDKDSL